MSATVVVVAAAAAVDVDDPFVSCSSRRTWPTARRKVHTPAARSSSSTSCVSPSPRSPDQQHRRPTLDAQQYRDKTHAALYSLNSIGPTPTATPTRTSSPTCPPTRPTRALFPARILARLSVRDARVNTCKRVLYTICYRVHVYKISR